MEAQWIRHLDDLDNATLAQWRALAERQGKPYCLPGWMLAWWRHASPAGAELRILLLKDGEDLAGVGPFFLDRRFGLRHLRLLGAGTSSTVAPLAENSAREDLAASVRGLLRESREAHVAMLEGVPVDEHWPDSILGGRLPPAERLYSIRGWTQPNPTLDMPEDGFDQWFQAKGGRFRARMRRGLRQLESMDGRVVLATGREQIETRLSEFEQLHSDRWKSRGGSGVLTRDVAKVLRNFAARSPQHLRLWAVEAEGRTVSVQVLVTAGGTTSHWLGGIDDSLTKLHPGAGVLSLYAAIEHAWKAGDRKLDFGAGGQSFKYHFADGEYQLEWSGVARARRWAVPARLPDLGEYSRLAVTRRLSPASKRLLRQLQRRIIAFRS